MDTGLRASTFWGLCHKARGKGGQGQTPQALRAESTGQGRVARVTATYSYGTWASPIACWSPVPSSEKWGDVGPLNRPVQNPEREG